MPIDDQSPSATVRPGAAIMGCAAVLASLLMAGCMQQPPEDPPEQTPAAAPAPDVPDVPAPVVQPPQASEDPDLAAHMKTPEFRRGYRNKMEQLQNEAAVQESAPWFGTTGLSDAQERHLPRYVRMELGQSLQDADAVQAKDLVYLGHFAEPDGTVHYWRIPSKTPLYAYTRKGQDGVFYTDMGNRTPPR